MLVFITNTRQRGFNIVELMVAITVMVILMSIAAPSFQSMMKNTQIRNAAESVSNGLQKARAEAVARNTNVSFVLGVNSSWLVLIVNTAAVVDSRSSDEGSSDVTLNVTPVGATSITFNNLGGVATNADGSASIQNINFNATGGTKDLDVQIGVGGNARMCDPDLVYASNPRGCMPAS